MTRYLALLRGINIGGDTSIRMADVVRVLGEGIAHGFGRDVGVLVRSLPELDAIITGNPFLGGQEDFTKLLVTFLGGQPENGGQARLASPAGETGELRLTGREVYVHVPDGYGRSKLSNAFVEKKLGVAATTRNWKSVLKLREMLAGCAFSSVRAATYQPPGFNC